MDMLCSQIAAEMQAARHGGDSTGRAGGASCISPSRRSFRQGEKRPVVVVITDVLTDGVSQTALIENNDIVEQVVALANPALWDVVPPRTLNAGSLELDSQGFNRVEHLQVDVRCAIKDQIFR